MSSGVSILVGITATGVGVGSIVLWLIPSWKMLLSVSLAGLIALTIFVTARHAQLISLRRSDHWPKPSRDTRDIRRRPQDYYLFVLGSGGHTKEMLMMMDDGFCNFTNFHRRYLISSGDVMSDNHLEDYEDDLAILCDESNTSPGTYDKHTVTRARRVHQPIWTTPFTALLSILDIFPALLSPPRSEPGLCPRYPSQIFSNGPATGFFVAVAAYLLRMFYLVPEDCMRFVYVESWARITTLSLTGKLLYATGLADVFMVQHEAVAVKYGLVNAGEMVFNSRRPDA